MMLQLVANVALLTGFPKAHAFAEHARKSPVAEPAPREPEVDLVLEPVVVPVINTRSTAIGFQRRSRAPWKDGNFLTFHFRKASAPGQPEEWASWRVVNIHSENFAEITKRLGLQVVEVRVLHSERQSVTITDQNGSRAAIEDQGFAIVTDARIPRKWLLSEPGRNWGGAAVGMEPETRKALKAAYPRSFAVERSAN